MILFVLSYCEMVPNIASQQDEYKGSNIPHIEFDQKFVYQKALGGYAF